MAGRLQILSQNLNTSLAGQLQFLNNKRTNRYNILCLQEPHIDFIGNTKTIRSNWIVVYPTDRKTRRTLKYRSVIFIKKSLASGQWEELEIEGMGDITAITIKTEQGQFSIFSIYVDSASNNNLQILR
ncbi:hypothetical protein DL96DRAFT_1482288 [Flagelloscypha sp. PMI_526]|nr:hypothetical protein DL96DRAFT_1482288 [Flagelloscypha sp. PMI_526]